MTATLMVLLRCNDCDRSVEYPYLRTVPATRRAARAAGWMYQRHRDLCPACAHPPAAPNG